MRIPRTQSLGTLLIVAMGLWCLVQSLMMAPYMIFGFFAGDSLLSEWLWPQLASLALYLVAGTGLLVLRAPLSATLFARDSDFELDELTLKRAEEILVAAMGLWLVASALANGIAIEAEMAITFEQNRDVLELGSARGRTLISPEAWARRLSYLPKLIIGLALTLGAGSITRFWHLTRRAGSRS
ncbi:MAG: hypothetical protein JRG94_13475 [Deltaproteobacteria bacterium]|nr:hypothetical protein [Deltaproteobacteria bacterium]